MAALVKGFTGQLGEINIPSDPLPRHHNHTTAATAVAAAAAALVVIVVVDLLLHWPFTHFNP